jgi:hypothetical protein
MAIDPVSFDPSYQQQQIAGEAARAAYANAQAQGLAEQIAIAKAKEAFDEKMGTASMTGMWNDSPTWAVDQALGVAPGGTFTPGSALLNQQTLYGNSGGAAGGGMPTEEARQFNVNTSGYLANGDPTLAREENQNQTTLGLLNTEAGLGGPQNYLKYARVLNGTPQGLRDILNAAAGRFNLPAFGGGAAPNYTGQGSAIGTAPNASAGGGAVNPDGSLNPMAVAKNIPYSPTAGGSRGSVDMGQASLASLADAQNNPGAYTPSAADLGGGLVNPNQINVNNFTRMSPTQRAMDIATYQDQGWNADDIRSAINAAAGRYRGAQRGSYSGMFAA